MTPVGVAAVRNIRDVTSIQMPEKNRDGLPMPRSMESGDCPIIIGSFRVNVSKL
jgi:hypothetical protein